MQKPPTHEVLLAEDNSLILKLELRSLKKLVNCPIKGFWQGGELIDYLKQTANAGHLQLIFLDLNMPRVNGWDVLDFLEDFKYKNSIYVVVLSSSMYQPDKERAFKYSRVIGYHDKFIDTQELLEILNQDVLMKNFNFQFKEELDEDESISRDQTLDFIS
ncbi:CheY chemotaxis protein or a CheY-like REC (receiver) domain [Salegentibacter holothuriorum]|uniref:CheY chemotaxis protein or a CheY-like REC (Receiver) domain n=1 Tax=Salegentibacter holothuriorum TaxID=241145 RepID=A0A1T5DW20_9FLAO|nr:response regulator [Salegentibacter holothuriorum]SKB75613.1 CheY chemotaxis protein or a CheY-like REC (receiver) domain [Salegentibacter holothuriorum]